MGTESLTATTSDAAAQEGTVGVNAVLKAQGRTTRTRRASETRATRMSIDTALEHRLAQGDQILLVLDEAHTLRKDAAQALFNAYQVCGTKGVALDFAFAGTPDLPGHLAQMGVTFIERPGGHGQTPLGPMSDANAAMAVLAPFAERGVLPEGAEPSSPGGIFKWSPEGGAGDSFQAGIPSLTGYVLEAAAPSTAPLMRMDWPFSPPPADQAARQAKF